mgnify:CR=1 FL=1
MRRASEEIKMFIPRSCDIGLLCSNMRIEANNGSYDLQLKTQYFKTHVDRHYVKILEQRSRDMKKLANLRRELRRAVSKLKCSYLVRVISDFSLQT